MFEIGDIIVSLFSVLLLDFAVFIVNLIVFKVSGSKKAISILSIISTIVIFVILITDKQYSIVKEDFTFDLMTFARMMLLSVPLSFSISTFIIAKRDLFFQSIKYSLIISMGAILAWLLLAFLLGNIATYLLLILTLVPVIKTIRE